MRGVAGRLLGFGEQAALAPEQLGKRVQVVDYELALIGRGVAKQVHKRGHHVLIGGGKFCYALGGARGHTLDAFVASAVFDEHFLDELVERHFPLGSLSL